MILQGETHKETCKDVRFGDGTYRERAANFRKLVEPFSIANYYHRQFDVDSGHYLASDNRPWVYSCLDEAEAHPLIILQGLGGVAVSPVEFESGAAWAQAKLDGADPAAACRTRSTINGSIFAWV